MAAVPLLSGQKVVKVFTSLGWSVSRQRGSHIIMTKPGEMATLQEFVAELKRAGIL